MAFELSKEREQKLAEILARYPTKMAACIPLLHLCQEQNGYISEDVMHVRLAQARLVARARRRRRHVLHAVQPEPVGKHQVWVCRTLPCALRGADEILAHCEKKLGIHVRRDDEGRQDHASHAPSASRAAAPRR